jgi:PqqD family protein of HPr-rel-A system
MSKRPNPLQNLAVSDSGFVFDPMSGATFTLNTSGLVILNALREGLSLDETVARVHERFEDVAADTKDDVLDFVQRLRQHGLLPSDFALGGAR